MTSLSDSVIIYGASWCSWCERAKSLCETHGLDLDYRNVDIPEVKQQLKEDLPTVKSIPQIWWGGTYIGGCEQFEQQLNNALKES